MADFLPAASCNPAQVGVTCLMATSTGLVAAKVIQEAS